MVPEEGLSKVGLLMKATAERLALLWANQIGIGQRVVLKSSGTTGEVKKILPWGVEVEVKFGKVEREIWSWEMIVKRNPRSIKRYPRPFRFPRTEVTKQCHCKGGPMSIVPRGDNAVRCQNKKCKQLIGSEGFPKRIEQASKLLYQAALAKQSKEAASKRIRRSSKPKIAHPAKSQAPKTSGALGIRPPRPAATGASATVSSKPKKQKSIVVKREAPAKKTLGPNPLSPPTTKPKKANKARPKARSRRTLPIPEEQVVTTQKEVTVEDVITDPTKISDLIPEAAVDTVVEPAAPEAPAVESTKTGASGIPCEFCAVPGCEGECQKGKG
jgi:hypothetical protein